MCTVFAPLGVHPAIVEDLVSAIRSRVVVPLSQLESIKPNMNCDSLSSGPRCGRSVDIDQVPLKGFAIKELLSNDEDAHSEYMRVLGQYVYTVDNLKSMQEKVTTAADILEIPIETSLRAQSRFRILMPPIPVPSQLSHSRTHVQLPPCWLVSLRLTEGERVSAVQGRRGGEVRWTRYGAGDVLDRLDFKELSLEIDELVFIGPTVLERLRISLYRSDGRDSSALYVVVQKTVKGDFRSFLSPVPGGMAVVNLNEISKRNLRFREKPGNTYSYPLWNKLRDFLPSTSPKLRPALNRALTRAEFSSSVEDEIAKELEIFEAYIEWLNESGPKNMRQPSQNQWSIEILEKVDRIKERKSKLFSWPYSTKGEPALNYESYAQSIIDLLEELSTRDLFRRPDNIKGVTEDGEI